jgi:hypothetical protein
MPNLRGHIEDHIMLNKKNSLKNKKFKSKILWIKELISMGNVSNVATSTSSSKITRKLNLQSIELFSNSHRIQIGVCLVMLENLGKT